ncbi:stress-inducible protein STI1 [Perkinsela sp. CCAP 1560/4]|nr:stress-inducible protein STI1 [Perkinsela sp. CCAP 1560/4]|eukprot:KNH08062.1 stress-inducible protein STI1 [Perkinsela sp. CCAP 1560/4]
MEDFKSKGNAAFKQGNFADAIDFYSKAIAALAPEDSQCAALYSNRAASNLSLGNKEAALSDAEKCIEAKPEWVKGYFRKGMAYNALERYAEAEKAFEVALEYDKENYDIQDRLNNVRATLKDQRQKVRPSNCTSAEQAKTIGNSFFKEGKYEKAISFYTRAIDMTKDDDVNKVNYYNNRAACYTQTHNYPCVITDCTMALQLDASNLKAKLRRAYAYKGNEKWKLALADFQEVQARQPSPNISQEITRCKKYSN